MLQALLITIRSLTGTYHGTADRGRAEWPPSPFRLFQALVAGAHGGRWAKDDPERDAVFTWLEAQDPPDIYAPRAQKREEVTLFVPNNDLDAKGGDPQRVGEIRTSKTLRPQTFDVDLPIYFLWKDVSDDGPCRLPAYVNRLHTLGLGLDAAYAEASFLDATELAAFRCDPRLIRHQPGGSGAVPVPMAGSYASLKARHAAFGDRLRSEGKGRKAKTAFRQPPKARYGAVGYDKPPHRLFFALRRPDARETAQAVPATRAVRLVEALRDRVATVFEGSPLVDRLVTGKTAGSKDIADRLRIIPLPSTGHAHADRLIRRVLIEIPQTSPLRPEAIAWALDGHEIALSTDGARLLLAASAADGVTRRYLDQTSRCWRTVTPLVLARRDEASLRQALRQAGIDARLQDATLRREPFLRQGRYADDYIAQSRFPPTKTVHAQLRFAEPIKGPVLIGDGRFLGLGLCEPFEPEADDSWAFIFGTALPLSGHVGVARQFRRALMARVQALIGSKSLPAVITGHEPDGRPLRGGKHEHLFYRPITRDGALIGIEVLAPHLVAGGGAAPGWAATRREVAEALSNFSSLRFDGKNIRLAPIPSDPPSAGLRLVSATRYVTTRRPRPGDDRAAFVGADIMSEAKRCAIELAGDPDISAVRLEASGRLSAHVELRLTKVCTKYILLGATSHCAGGAFEKSALKLLKPPQ